MLKPVVAACVTACVVALSILVAFASGTVAQSPRYTLHSLRVSGGSDIGTVDCLYRIDVVSGAVEAVTTTEDTLGPDSELLIACPKVIVAPRNPGSTPSTVTGK